MANPETVKFYLIDQDGDPITGVLVRVYDSDGAVFITQQVTSLVGDDAVAEVTLDGDDPPIEYTIRLSKTGVAFDGSLGNASKTPQLITIYSPPAEAPGGTNNFQIKGETFSRPTATDPRLCRLSGFFRDIAGRPLAGLEMRFINEFGPAVVDSMGIMGEGIDIVTDREGYAVIDLYRNGQYLAWVSGAQAVNSDETSAFGFPRHIAVPDQGSVNMPDILFPIVSSITFTPSSVSLNVGQSVDITTVVTADDGRTLSGTGCNDVYYAVTDTSVANVSVTETKLTVVGIEAGTTTLTATRKDQSIVKIPATGISGQPITITIT